MNFHALTTPNIANFNRFFNDLSVVQQALNRIWDFKDLCLHFQHSIAAWYAIFIRRASVLSAASLKFYLAVGTLADQHFPLSGA
jgi:hypothetical protein